MQTSQCDTFWVMSTLIATCGGGRMCLPNRALQPYVPSATRVRGTWRRDRSRMALTSLNKRDLPSAVCRLPSWAHKLVRLH